MAEGSNSTLALLAFDGIGTSARDAAIQDTVATGITFFSGFENVIPAARDGLELTGSRAVRSDLAVHGAVITLLQCLLDAIAAEHVRVTGSVRREEVGTRRAVRIIGRTDSVGTGRGGAGRGGGGATADRHACGIVAGSNTLVGA
jgi:hypothetical protein